jgi:queuosine precursor transporter
MLRLPHHVVRFGRLQKDKVFQEIDSKLEATDDGKSKIYPILSLRFWGHAHIYSPVFSLIFFYVIGDLPNRIALTLLMVSLGSLSFAICDSYGGAYADKNGCISAIRLGLRLMIGLMVFFGAITFFNEELGRSLFIILWTIGQIMIGFPLALIDGADTELTKKVSRKLNKLSQADGDHLEGVCTKLKYSGIALTSFIGCFLFVMVPAWSGARRALVGTVLFLLTAVSQRFALTQLSRVQEPDTSESPGADADTEGAQRQKTIFGRFRVALRAIYDDKVLATWILIIAVTEGWLLFSTYYFQLDALKNLIANADGVPILLLIIPILYWLLSAVASFGGSYFNTWHKKAAGATRGEESNHIKLRGGSVFDIPYVRLLAAGEILAIMLGVFVLHLAISTISPQDHGQIGQRSYWLSLIPLLFYAVYQFLRGFAHPLLKTTLSNMVADRKLQNPTTTLSIATAGGRFFHAVSATLFIVCLEWVTPKSATGGRISTYTEALTATIVIVVLTILGLNVLSGVALDRKNKKDARETVQPPILKDIPVILGDRTFRSTVIKGAFFVCLVMSNILGPKLSAMSFLWFNAGAIPYALTFMLLETVAETDGKPASRRLWLGGICSYVVVGVLVFIAVQLPPAPTENLETIAAYNALFSRVLILVFGSLCSFTVAQYLDIWLFLLLKRVTRNRALWLRSNLSTFIAQTIDTVIFISIGFGIPSMSLTFWSSELIPLVIGQLGMKWMFSLLYTPLLYLAVRWIENGKDSVLTRATE